jgi:hypothetical protein
VYINIHTVHSALLHYSLILKWIPLFPPLNLHAIMTLQKLFFRNFCKCIKNEKRNYYIYISIQTLYFTLLKHLWQQLQTLVFLGMMLQTWHTCIWGVSTITFCRSSQALSGWMGSVTAQLFSGLYRDVRSGSSLGSGWATQEHSENWPESTLALSWLCA